MGMKTIQKPKRMWQKKKDYNKKKLIRKIQRRNKTSFDGGKDTLYSDLKTNRPIIIGDGLIAAITPKPKGYKKGKDCFDVGTDDGQQMIYQDGDQYFAGPSMSAATTKVTPYIQRLPNDKSTWDFVDNAGKLYTTKYSDDQLKYLYGQNTPESEFYNWIDRSGKEHRQMKIIPVSPVDPIGEMAVETAAGYPLFKGAGMIGRQFLKDYIRDFSYTKSGNWLRNKIFDREFKSELDWSPESWFSTRVTKQWTKEDAKALKRHLPEYLKIEKEAKANGTWLKMPDGSIYPGDPRSWVQMMSQAYNKYTGKSPFKYQVFSHSSPHKFDKFDISHFGETDQGFYGKGFYAHPAENINGKLIGRNSYGDNNYLLTTNVQKPFDLNNPDFEYAGLFNWERTNAPKGIFDGYDSVYYGIPGNKTVGASPAELVVPKPTNYKSLLGNNGNFNVNDENIYRILLPLVGLGGIAANKNHNSGKDIHIKKANRGKFTEAANEHNMGVQEFARQVLSAPKGKYSSTLRKRANFARNFAH